jgi:arginyl-tRNA synthetase
MKESITIFLTSLIKDMGAVDSNADVSVPENPDHGDYSTNIALRLSKILKKPPMDIALSVSENLKSQISMSKLKGQNHNTPKDNQTMSRESSGKVVLQDIERVEVVAPGFINFYLTVHNLITQVIGVLNNPKAVGTSQTNKGKTVMVEFAHPNTHKAFHIGHLRNITTGESIVRLLESTGYEVVRANYQGDVGMHIAKCLYGILKFKSLKFNVKSWQEARTLSLTDRVEYLGEMYAAGSKAYDDNEAAKKEIGEINKKIYAKDPSIYPVYQETRQWSLDYFEHIYKRVGSHYDRYYFEGEVYEAGKKTVLEGRKKGIFVESKGAIIFPGEKFKLHNRVFITSEGNATYEGKDMGLAPLQFKEYHPERIIHVVGPEQASYFQVVFEALAQMFPETRGREYHLIYGWVKLKEGKMSSRSGNVVLGEWLLNQASKSIRNILKQSDTKYTEAVQKEIAEKAAVAAVKYSFLHVATESEIAFDIASSVNINGDSGPYLQYTYARCMSVLRKSGEYGKNVESSMENISNTINLSEEEKRLMQTIAHFNEVVEDAAKNLSPSVLCTYLFHLAQQFNLFYSKHSILGTASSKEISHNGNPSTKNFRIAVTHATATLLMRGLYFLGIEVLEQM